MAKEQDKWTENIFNSMKGSQRAAPHSNLFEKIKSQIPSSNVKVVSRLLLKYVALAACLILILNVTVVLYFNQQIQTTKLNSSPLTSEDYTLINSFPIYN